MLKEEYPSEYQLYQELYQSQQFQQTAEIVHKLKHKLNVCGMPKGYRLAVDHENELKQHNDQLHAEFMRTLEQVNDFIKEL